MKLQRQSKILEIISGESVETQEDLLARLIACGFAVTQATVSRDIRELRLVKTLAGNGVYRYAASGSAENGGEGGGPSPRLRTIFRESVTSVDLAQNLVIVKTMPGMASAACAALDALMQDPAVAGSLAGDDTAFIALRDNKAAENFADKLRSLFR